MGKIKFSGREGVIVFLAVAVFVGLAIGSGALDFGSLLSRIPSRAAPAPGKVAAASASAVAAATHG